MTIRFLSPVAVSIFALSLTQCTVPIDQAQSAPAIKAEAEKVSPASDAVPAKVKTDCLAKLGPMVGGKPMKVVSAVKGETSYIVDIQVEGAENLWRCYHDGTQCTGTVYQGEG